MLRVHLLAPDLANRATAVFKRKRLTLYGVASIS
jgi:hypothetical protein